MIFRTAYRGDSACQDKAAQMIFRRRRSSICQDKARRLFRTAYWGIQLARTKRGAGADDIQAQAQFDMPGQSAAPIQDGLLGDSACQDKTRRRRLSGRLTGGIQLARTSRRR